MKKISIVFVVIAVLALASYTYLANMDITTESLEYLTIDGSEISSDYKEDFITLLNERTSTEPSPGASTVVSTEIAVGTRLKDMSFKARFMSDNRLYLEDSKGRFFEVNEPVYSYLVTHEAFDSLYVDLTESVQFALTESGLPVTPQSSENEYMITKFDGNWHEYTDKTTDEHAITHLDEVPSFVLDEVDASFTFEVNGTEQPSLESVSEVMSLDGTYNLKITANYEDKSGLRKGINEDTYVFVVDMPASFVFDKNEVSLGDIIEVRVINTNEGEVPYLEQDFYKRFKFFEEESGYVGYIPLTYFNSDGTYTVTYGIEGQGENSAEIKVNPYDFNIQHLTISTSVTSVTQTNDSYAQFAEYFTPRRYESDDEDYTNGDFILPVAGRVSTEFGETRYVNGSPTSYRHSGIDIAAPTGTEIVSTNAGKVKLAMHLTLTGNTVLIDHGNGFFSAYFHMDELGVEEGQMVEKGQNIGTVGTTGNSTGPHLHFIISYFDRNIEPGNLIYGQPVTYENYKELFGLE